MKRQIHDNLVISTCFIVRFNSIILFSNISRIVSCFLNFSLASVLRLVVQVPSGIISIYIYNILIGAPKSSYR